MASRRGPRVHLPTRPTPYPRFDGTQPCLQIGPEAFVIPGGQHQGNAEAKRVCGPCPFLYECREFAVSYDVVGVWGGTTYADRRRTRDRLRIEAIPVALTDTRSARQRVAELDDGRLSAEQVARLVGCSAKTVERHRKAAA